ncbi:MAG TPA: copper resistance protein CopC [Solirubrobacterales bacterium]|nr:copper resistance protein CopC [Solirubrobacterales bacterium]
MAISPASASAHAGLLGSEPAAGARLGAPPEAVRLSFSELPEASLSEIRVLGPGGAPVQLGRPRKASGDPLALEVPVKRLARGVYTVSWKIFSAVDAHATSGTFAFGVRASPAGVATSEGATTQSSSMFELLARLIFLLGTVALIGGAVAGVARFGGSSGSDLALAAGGWAVAAGGLVLLAAAQRSIADSPLGELLDTSVGQALIWRAAGLALAASALLVAWRKPKVRRAALAVAAGGALGAVLAHVGAGHAGAGGWPSAVAVSAQVSHFAAAGVWFGGLAALLLGFRGAHDSAREAAISRFSVLALASLLVVFATGILRAVDELGSPGELLSSGYGRAVLVKLALIGLIAAIAARNRRPRGPTAFRDLAALPRRARRELALAVAAIAVAALLGTLAPPVSGGSEPAGLSVTGEDFGTTTRVELSTASDEPGPNLFTVQVEDPDSGERIAVDGVSLRFSPLDDPGSPSSSLRLSPGPDDVYVGSGPDLAFDGRWRVDALVERRTGAVEIPLELDLPVPEHFVSTRNAPGSPDPPEYTMQTENGYIRISPDPDRPGPSRVYVSTYTVFENSAATDQLVLTAAAAGDPPTQQPVRRLGISRFVADVDLEAGPFEIGVVARTRDGTRLRGVFQIDIPE